jgi:hypothetical protein
MIPGHDVVLVRLIMRIVPSNSYNYLLEDQFLVYVQRFDIVPQFNPQISATRGRYPEPASSLYVLKRAKRANGNVVGDIVPLSQLRALVELTPRYGNEADKRLTANNSMHFTSEFWLDKYFDKELFYVLDAETYK